MANDLNRELVERRAYELYERRGRGDGHDWEDWLQAERELRDEEAENELAGALSGRHRRAEGTAERGRRGQVNARPAEAIDEMAERPLSVQHGSAAE
jgi:hypothetical protein